jgi:hypothetical protein
MHGDDVQPGIAARTRGVIWIRGRSRLDDRCDLSECLLGRENAHAYGYDRRQRHGPEGCERDPNNESGRHGRRSVPETDPDTDTDTHTHTDTHNASDNDYLCSYYLQQ